MRIARFHVLRFCCFRKIGEHQVGQIADTLAVRGRNGKRFAERQFVKLGIDGGRGHALGLVDDQPDFAPGFAQPLGNRAVLRRQSLPAVDEQ